MSTTFRSYWATKTDSDHSLRAGIDVFSIAAAEIRAFYDPHRWPRVLEIGCGAGEVFGHVGFPPATYFGVDISESMLDQFRAAHPAVRTQQGDAVTFVAHSTFDFIVVNNVVQYLDPTELNSLVGNVARMLAPGGRALLGNVPDRALRVVFAQRARASSRRSAAVRVAGYTAEWLSAQFTPNRPTPRLGYWHTRRAVTHAAADAKLTAEFFGCLLYWYRFSALLAPSELGSIGSGVHVVPAP